MIAIFLTHAEAKRVEPNQFRALSEKGRTQVAEAATRFLEIAKKLVPDLISKQLLVGEIISSPLARCVETALHFSDAIKEYTASSEIGIRNRLREQRAGQLSAGDLVSVLDDTSSEAVLICTHGDLAGALPGNTAFRPESVKKGWFVSRPVLVLVEYERKSNWDAAKVMCCESSEDNWETLLVKQDA